MEVVLQLAIQRVVDLHDILWPGYGKIVRDSALALVLYAFKDRPVLRVVVIQVERPVAHLVCKLCGKISLLQELLVLILHHYEP